MRRQQRRMRRKESKQRGSSGARVGRWEAERASERDRGGLSHVEARVGQGRLPELRLQYLPTHTDTHTYTRAHTIPHRFNIASLHTQALTCPLCLVCLVCPSQLQSVRRASPPPERCLLECLLHPSPSLSDVSPLHPSSSLSDGCPHAGPFGTSLHTRIINMKLCCIIHSAAGMQFAELICALGCVSPCPSISCSLSLSLSLSLCVCVCMHACMYVCACLRNRPRQRN